jgi:glyoxylase-like metal-dependent hydrolase (beta-lactamase superfamily II)
MKIERIIPGMGIRSDIGTMGAAGVTMIEDDTRIIVDVGHFGMRDVLLAELKKRNLTPKDFDIVILTHIHWDHCLNVDLFENAKVILGRDELRLGALNAKPDRHSEDFKGFLRDLKAEGAFAPYRVSENTSIMDSPGHTPGHISVKAEAEDGVVIFTGDSIPGLRAYRRGVPDLVFYDFEKAKQSVSNVKEMKPKMIIPGHDRPFNDAGYLARDSVEFVFRKESEENMVFVLKDVESDPFQIRY